MEGTPALLLHTLLLKNKYRLDFEELEHQLLSHPSYPSLYSITSVLEHFGIENLALEVPTDMETLQQLPVIFLSMIHGHELVLVERMDSKVKLSFQGNSKPWQVGYQEFLEIWSGEVIAVEEGANEVTDRKITWQGLPRVLLVISIMAPIVLFLTSFPDLFQTLHFFAGLGGLFISILIIRYELGSPSDVMNRFCNVNNSTSCDVILQSKGATVLNLFKLSDACVVYFSSITLTWILNTVLGYYDGLFVILSVLGLPAIIYSVYYQFHILKKWCPLCLGISAVLFVQLFSTLFLRDGWSWTFDLTEALILLFCTIATISIWAFTKPLLLVKRKFAELRMNHFRFKRNFYLFQAAHYKGKPYSTQLSTLNDEEITLGSPEARISLVLVTSPSCAYCRAAHSELQTILHHYPNDIRLIVRCNVPVHDTTNIGFKVANRLNQLFLAEGDADGFSKALDEAFEKDVNLEGWLDRWGGDVDFHSHKALLEEQRQWCMDNQIHFTPTLILNGKQYPKEYERMDLIHFIDELLDAEAIRDIHNQEKSVELTLEE